MREFAQHAESHKTMPNSVSGWAQSVVEAHLRIRTSVRRTPVEEISELFPSGRSRVWAKLENEQETGSFKLRGATNRILQLTAKEWAQGIVAASNGNHGLGVAAAAKRVGISAEVYVSAQVAPQKAKRIEEYGARIQRAGSDPLDAEVTARQRAMESGRVFISPYNDWDVLAGQGTIAVELLEQIPQLDAVFVAVGGGGLIGGIGTYLKHTSPRTEIVGCWPENSPVLYESMKAGWILPVEEKPTVSESTAGGLEEGSITLEVCHEVVGRSVLVSEGEILDAMRLIHRRKHWLVEGAAGVALAGFIKAEKRYEGQSVAVVICGGNVSQRVKDLL
jgi:threonine dehydratase